MNASRKKASSTTHDICLIVLTILFVVSVFFFTAILSHSALGSEDTGSRVPVVNNIAKWTNKIIEAGAEDIRKIEKILERSPHEVHTYLPTIAPTHTPIVLNLRGPAVKVPPAEPDHPDPDTIHSGATMGTTIPYHELSCPHGELLTFWQRTTAADQQYESPFLHSGPPVKYVTFEPDVGGWNNIRMQMELVIVFAYATGRTLVLPPDQPMYLLNKGKGHQKAHSFADFFPFDYINQRMSVISMEEFMRREAVSGQLRNSSTHRVEYPPGNKTEFNGEEKTDRLAMWDYLRSVGSCPPWKALNEFVVIPVAPGVNVSHLPPARAKVYADKRELFGAKRYAQYYDEHWQQQKLIHFISKPGMGYRLLEHFYTFIHFEDDAMDRYYKRFVRDYVHYIDIIFCKAAKIINKLLEEGGGSYSSFHVRRGEFQYKEVKIPADRMLHNVGQFIPKGQLLFIATDEHNKSFFDPFLARFPKIHYLDDFMDYAELRDINPNFLGMIDQVICTRGEVFVGTWFSTFTGYITRMRGYMGYSDKLTYFGDMAHRDRYQQFEQPKFPFYMREWNTSWHQIDVV